jgi:hypothetical protein
MNCGRSHAKNAKPSNTLFEQTNSEMYSLGSHARIRITIYIFLAISYVDVTISGRIFAKDMESFTSEIGEINCNSMMSIGDIWKAF